MAKPYSMDLRERVVAAVLAEGMTCHASAARFGVAASSAIKSNGFGAFARRAA